MVADCCWVVTLSNQGKGVDITYPSIREKCPYLGSTKISRFLESRSAKGGYRQNRQRGIVRIIREVCL